MTDQPKPERRDADQDLQRVREILFGAEQRRHSDELARLEKHFQEQLDTARAAAESTRKQLEDEIRDARTAAERERAELRSELEQKLAELREGKIDRDDLAEMFGGIVSRLGTATKQLDG